MTSWWLATLVVILLTVPQGAAIPGQHGPTGGSSCLPMLDGGEGPVVSLDALRAFGDANGFFVENLGQVGNDQVRFYAMGETLSVGLTPAGAVFTFTGDDVAAPQAGPGGAREGVAFRLRYEGSNAVEPIGTSPMAHGSSFFIGNDPQRWVSDARSYREVLYVDLYDGIDLRFYFHAGMLKYDLIVNERGDPDSIRFRYDGVERVEVDPATGDMLLYTPVGTVRDASPILIPPTSSGDVARAIHYKQHDDGAYGFEIPGMAMGQRPLTIDPGLLFSTYIAETSMNDFPINTALDKDGNILVEGFSEAPEFPTTVGAYNRSWSLFKGFILKFDPTLSHLLYSTFYGGTYSDTWGETRGWNLKVLSNGDILLVGHTVASDFPVTDDAFDKNHHAKASDAFIMVMDADLSRLIYSSYLGGSGDDYPLSTMILEDGSLLIAGSTHSPDLPTTDGAFQGTKAKGLDVFILKFDGSFKHLQFCTYLGGSGDDEVEQGPAIAVDDYGFIYVAGKTSSPDFPTTGNAYQETPQGNLPDVFIAKLNHNCSRLVYGTYIGGDSEDSVNWLHVNQVGKAYIVGSTMSPDFPVTNDAVDSTLEGTRGLFILEVDQNGWPWYCTFFGGDTEDNLRGVVLDPIHYNIIITLETMSTDLPCTQGCYNPRYNWSAGALAIVVHSIISRNLEYCTYFGAPNNSALEIIPYESPTLDADGNLYMVGATRSTDFPTTKDAYLRSGSGNNYDGFILRLDLSPVPVPDAPTGFEVWAGDSVVNIEWDRYYNESYVTLGYTLYRGVTPDQMDQIATINDGTSYTDLDVVNGKRYYYMLRAVNSMGQGSPTDTKVARPVGTLSEPANVTAITGNGTVVLAWDPPRSTGGVEVLGYHVLRGPEEASTVPLGTVLSQCNFTDTNVVPGVTYWYAVIAYNERGNGTVSTPIRVKALDRASPPAGFRAVAGNGWVNLSWDPPESSGGATILGYVVYRGTSLEGMALLGTTMPNASGYNDTTVEGGLVYHYNVAAMTEAGDGRPSETVSARPTGVPGPPSGLVLRPDDGRVRLSWEVPETDRGMPITGYRVYCGITPDSLDLVESLGDIREITHRDLRNGVEYYFAVSAVNQNGVGPRCEAMRAVPMGPSDAPLNLTAVVATGHVTLRWQAPAQTGGAPSLGYIVLRGASKDALERLTPDPLWDVLTYEDVDVVVGASYYYAVLAINPYGAEGERTLCIEVLVAAPPGPVSGLRAEAGDGLVRLSWVPPSDAGGLPVSGYIVLKEGPGTAMVEVAYPGGTSWEDVFVDNGVTYTYAVRALNRAGVGPHVEMVNATPLACPLAPEGLSVRYSDGSAVLRWGAPPGPCSPITGYVLMRGASPGRLEVLAEVGMATEYVDRDVKPGRTYYYSVRAESVAGEGARAEPVRLEVPEGTGGLQLIAIALAVIIATIVAVTYFLGRRGRAAPLEDGPKGDGDARDRDEGKLADGPGEGAGTTSDGSGGGGPED